MWELLGKIAILITIRAFILENKKIKKLVKKGTKVALKQPLKPWYSKTFGIGSIFILTPFVIILSCLGFTLSVLNGNTINIAIAKVLLLSLCTTGFLYFNYKLYYPSRSK
ncbi:hypothetical protein [uncultured Maribacter sp.]|uniref:hypothetical protein n=1 Tax=uncultured Maribacter sp. TaxID=431308 RepID=UPI002610E8EB|nr:hypothetical protein [uncultured Maribacter sp.]